MTVIIIIISGLKLPKFLCICIQLYKLRFDLEVYVKVQLYYSIVIKGQYVHCNCVKLYQSVFVIFCLIFVSLSPFLSDDSELACCFFAPSLGCADLPVIQAGVHFILNVNR